MAQPAVLLTPMGQLERYDPNNHKFDMWLGQFSEYCFLNNVPTEPVNAQGLVLPAHNRRRALFLAHIGSRAFEVVSAACAPRFPREHSIGQLSAMIKEVFENPGHQESNRVLFHGRIQKQDESVFEYVSALQLLAQNCNFGAAYPMIMKTRLIFGIRHADTKVKLLNPLMSFEEAKRIAIDDDRIRIHMKSLAQQTTNNVNAVTVRNGHQSFSRGSARGRGRGNRGGSNSYRGFHRGGRGHFNPNSRGNPAFRGNSNRGTHHSHNQSNINQSNDQSNFSQQPNGNKWRPCRRCNRQHDERTCPAVNWKCFKCNKFGHIASKCLSKVDNVQVSDNNNNNSNDNEFQAKVIYVNQTTSPPVYIDVNINSQVLQAEVDTGAGVSLISSMYLNLMFSNIPLNPCHTVLVSASGPIQVLGEVSVQVSVHQSKSFTLPLIVCNAVEKSKFLFGRPWLDVFFPDWRKQLLNLAVSVSSVSIPNVVSSFLKLYPKNFDPTNDNPIKFYSAKLILKDNCVPFRHPVVEGVVVRYLGGTRYAVNVQGVIREPHVNQLSRSPVV